MQKKFLPGLLLMVMLCGNVVAQQDYLKEVKEALQKKWPENHSINLVFHGHSVPSGYFRTPDVRTLDAYPAQVLEAVKKIYPTAVVNVIVTAIGGENSEQGEKRFRKEVLVHRPDVLFIDYALNDRKIGPERSKKAMESMIRQALKRKIKVILLTPSPDLSVDWAKPGSELDQLSDQLKELASTYSIGLADPYDRFKKLLEEKKDLKDYMAQSNHPNREGHAIIAETIMQYFK